MNIFKMRHVDLCAGTGTFSLALSSALKDNVKTVFVNDLLPESKKIYELNFDCKVTLGDINIIKDSVPEHDILTAGFPCQPFSIAGKQEGFEDTRSGVFWSIIDIMKKHKPRIVILENVKNLKTHDGGNSFNIIIKAIQDANYGVHHDILNACDYGSRQNRERLFIVCIRNDYTLKEYKVPLGPTGPTGPQAPDVPKVPSKYYYTSNSAIYNKLVEAVTKENVYYQYRRHYVRENKSNLCPTLTHNMGTGGHNVPIIKEPNGIRKLTPRECFDLQGFPKSYKFGDLSDTKLYSLAGNAICLNVLEVVVKTIIKEYPKIFTDRN